MNRLSRSNRQLGGGSPPPPVQLSGFGNKIGDFVGTKTVRLIAIRHDSDPSTNSMRQCISNALGGTATRIISVQQKNDFREPLQQQFGLMLRYCRTHQSYGIKPCLNDLERIEKALDQND